MPASIERTITAPYSTLQALVFALCLSGYPCIAIFPALFEVETRIFTIPYRAFVLGISLIVFFHFFKQGVRVFTGKYFWIPFLLFWAAYSFRLFYELVLIESPLGFEPEDYLLFTYGITLGPAIAFMFPAHNRTLNLARSLTFWLSVLALAGNMVVGWETIFLSDFSRFSSEALNAVSFAALGSVTVLISLTNLLADPQPTGRNVIAKNFVRAVYFLGMALGAIALFLSGSRGPTIATVLCAALLGYVAVRQNPRNLLPLSALTIAVVLAFLVWGGEEIVNGTLFERLRSISTLEDRSDTERLALWDGGFQQFLENPLFGSGLEEKVLQYYPHNIPLEAFMATGVFGGSAFVVALLLSIVNAFRLARLPAEFAWIAVLFLAIAFMSLLAGSVWGSSSLTQLMLAIMALSSTIAPVEARPKFHLPDDPKANAHRLHTQFLAPHTTKSRYLY